MTARAPLRIVPPPPAVCAICAGELDYDPRASCAPPARETALPPDVIEALAKAIARKIIAARNLDAVVQAVARSMHAHARLDLLPTRASLREIAAASFLDAIDAEINRLMAEQLTRTGAP